ncbi:MAG: response regulator transcription factor [Methylotetracoccus sp.]
MSKTTVLLADDHRLVRAGLRALIDELGDYEVVAEADDGREAVQAAVRLQPNIAILDLTMPGMNGLDATTRIVRDCPRTRVVILSMHATEHYVLEALCAGALAYVVKDCAIDELEQALRLVSAGESYLSPTISRHVIGGLTRLARGERGSRPSDNPIDSLTQRQREILQLIAEGNSTRTIAERLNISVKTVETHRSQIMRRLDIHDVASLTRFAIRNGLIADA